MSVKRLYSRYYCTKDTRHRVYPYDIFDSATEAPITGKTGEAVLLRTLNSGLSVTKWGWCWACEEFVQCQRRTQHQVMAEYYKREGVTIRVNQKELTKKTDRKKMQ